MKRYCTKMLDYDRWAMEKIASSFEENQVTDEKCLKLYAHIVQAYRHWLERFYYGTSSVHIWEFCSFSEAKERYDAFFREFEKYLDDKDDASLQETIQYQNSKGVTFEQPLEDIIMHVFNHATHHRGQIVSRLRELNYEPPVTDYIYYLRGK